MSYHASQFWVFLYCLFRDPLRKVSRDQNTVYSAADGVITQINDVEINGNAYKQVVTFLSVFNCHVNRIPLDGKITQSIHIPGKFLAAMRGDIDKKNERQETDIETSIGMVKSSKLQVQLHEGYVVNSVAIKWLKPASALG